MWKLVFRRHMKALLCRIRDILETNLFIQSSTFEGKKCVYIFSGLTQSCSERKWIAQTWTIRNTFVQSVMAFCRTHEKWCRSSWGVSTTAWQSNTCFFNTYSRVRTPNDTPIQWSYSFSLSAELMTVVDYWHTCRIINWELCRHIYLPLPPQRSSTAPALLPTLLDCSAYDLMLHFIPFNKNPRHFNSFTLSSNSVPNVKGVSAMALGVLTLIHTQL